MIMIDDSRITHTCICFDLNDYRYIKLKNTPRGLNNNHKNENIMTIQIIKKSLEDRKIIHSSLFFVVVLVLVF